MSGHRRTGQLLSPIWIIVRMPEPDNLTVEDLSKSVKQAPHSEQATGHVMHWREILLTPRCSRRAREFPDPSTFLYDVRWRSYGASNLPNFRILAFVGGTCAPPSVLLVMICDDPPVFVRFAKFAWRCTGTVNVLYYASRSSITLQRGA